MNLRGMKVVILGGAGNVAMATVLDLLDMDASDVAEIVLADLSPVEGASHHSPSGRFRVSPNT